MMEEFYTKAEAAQLLGVSTRQINNYFAAEKLTRIIRGQKAWIPKREVDELYTSLKRGPVVSQEAAESLTTRVGKLEKELKVLKLGLGHETRKPVRSETDLILLRQRMLDALSKKQWSVRQMMGVSKELTTMRDEEVELLLTSCGPGAWVPLCDLGRRMLQYVERKPEYPGDGLDVLSTKLNKALNRFYGIIYASTKIPGLVAPGLAAPALEMLEIPPNAIERHIAGYMTS